VLERAEFEELIRRARRRLDRQIPLIAGSGTNSTAKSLVMSRMAEEAGADALLVVTPYYNRPTQEGLFQHFSAIADAVRVPVIAYNVPSRTAAICSRHRGAPLAAPTHHRGQGHGRPVARPRLRDARPGFLLIRGRCDRGRAHEDRRLSSR
jgi:dihydrodipicolinate synthase/N-acetylneuraminate lyase